VNGGTGVPTAAGPPYPNVDQTSVYVGGTLNTPVTNLKLGASMDFLDYHDGANTGGTGNGTTWAWALYASYQATEKLGLNARGEYVENSSTVFSGLDPALAIPDNLYEITLTAQYDLWKNVLSRLEFRWDHAEHGNAFGADNGAGEGTRAGAYLLAANVIYKF
jgi:predicted porin